MDLSPTTTTTTPLDEKAWLASKHGIDSTSTITLLVSSFTPVGGVIKSGTPVKRNASTGLYELNANTTQCDGHIFEDVLVKTGSTNVGAALHWHGEVVAAKVPAPDGFAAAVGVAGAKLIRYV